MRIDVVVRKMGNSVHVLSSANFYGFMVYLLVSFVAFKLWYLNFNILYLLE